MLFEKNSLLLRNFVHVFCKVFCKIQFVNLLYVAWQCSGEGIRLTIEVTSLTPGPAVMLTADDYRQVLHTHTCAFVTNCRYSWYWPEGGDALWLGK